MPDWFSLYVVISLCVTVITAYVFYSVLLSDITVITGWPPIKKITFAYKFKEGSYKNCGQLFKESHSIGPELSSIVVFYDDPKKGPQCRYAVGSILSEGEDKTNEDLRKLYETSGFNIFSFPEVTHVVTASFPRRTFFSVLLGVRRVYSQLEHYIKERRLCAYPFLEIYRDGQIHFMAPLARQANFYVPEVRRVQRSPLEQEELHSDSDISGADSNSEYSSGSEDHLSDSREMSLRASWINSVPIQDERNRDHGGRRSWETSFQMLNCKETGGHQAEREEQFCGNSRQKSPEAHIMKWWGVCEGEE